MTDIDKERDGASQSLLSTDNKEDIIIPTTTTTFKSNGNQDVSSNRSKKVDTDVESTSNVTPLTAAPPDGGWGWVVVASSFTISLLVDGVCFSFGIFFDEFRNEFATNKAVTSWIGSVLNGSYLIFGPIVSALVNMYGCRRVTVFGAALSFVAFFLSTFSPNIGVLILTYGFLGGLGFGFMYLPAIVMVGYYFERRRALATGIACCGSGIGAFLFAPFTEILLQEYGWRGANWILSALICHGFACAIFYRPLLPPTPSPSDSTLMMEDGQLTDGISKLTVPPPDGHLVVNDVSTPINARPPEQKSSVISDQLKNEIYESLKSEPGSTQLYKTRSMSLHPPKTTSGDHNFSTSHTARLAFSQDLSLHHRKPPAEHHSDPMHKHSVPPLQRKDIFYSGSIWHLKEFKEVNSAEEYRRKIRDTSTVIETTASNNGGFIQSFFSVFDFSLLKSPTFLIYGASCFLCMAGFFVPFIYMPTHAMDMGLDSTSAAFLISIIGITNTVGRVAVGFISDQTWADCLLINNVALICGGIATLFVPFFTTYYLLAVYAAVFGSAIAVFVSLRSIIMVDLMGLEKLTTAFGFVIMCQGASSLLGPPVAGSISDFTGNYNASFYLAGVTLTLSGVICLPLRRIARWETNKRNMRPLHRTRTVST